MAEQVDPQVKVIEEAIGKIEGAIGKYDRSESPQNEWNSTVMVAKTAYLRRARLYLKVARDMIKEGEVDYTKLSELRKLAEELTTYNGQLETIEKSKVKKISAPFRALNDAMESEWQVVNGAAQVSLDKASEMGWKNRDTAASGADASGDVKEEVSESEQVITPQALIKKIDEDREGLENTQMLEDYARDMKHFLDYLGRGAAPMSRQVRDKNGKFVDESVEEDSQDSSSRDYVFASKILDRAMKQWDRLSDEEKNALSDVHDQAVQLGASMPGYEDTYSSEKLQAAADQKKVYERPIQALDAAVEQYNQAHSSWLSRHNSSISRAKINYLSAVQDLRASLARQSSEKVIKAATLKVETAYDGVVSSTSKVGKNFEALHGSVKRAIQSFEGSRVTQLPSAVGNNRGGSHSSTQPGYGTDDDE